MKATCKNSANLEQETKTTKIVTYPLLSLASSINVSELRVDVNKKLNKTMHVQARCLSQDSTFDLFQFLSKFFSQNLSCQTRGAAYL